MRSADKNVEQLELSYTADGKIKWYNNFGKWSGLLLGFKSYAYHVTQPFLSQVFSPRNKSLCAYKKFEYIYISVIVQIVKN
jgi:hypothetical protein